MRLQQHMLSRNTVHILCLRHVVALKQLAPYIQRSSLNRLSQYHFSIPIFHFYVGNFYSNTEWQNERCMSSNFARRITSAPMFTFDSSPARTFCKLPIPCREQSLPPELSLHSVWDSVYAPCNSATWKHEPSVPDVVLVNLFLNIVYRILCDSTVIFSWSFFEHETINRFISILDHSGRLVWWLLQSIAEALLTSYFFWRFLRSLHNQDHRSEWSVQLGFFLHISGGLYTVICLPYFVQSAGQKCPSLLVTCFFVNMPSTYKNPSGGFLLSNAKSCHTDAKFGQWLIAIHVAITIDGRLLKYVNAGFCLSRHIHIIQKYRKIVLRNKEFRPWSNIQQSHVISQNTPEILWSFEIWTRMSGFSFFYTFFLKWLPEIASRSAWYTTVDDDCPSYNGFARLAWQTRSMSLFECAPLLIWTIFNVNLEWFHRFSIIRIRYK